MHNTLVRHLCFFLLPCSFLHSTPPPADWFACGALETSPSIYREGWIDLNKSGAKDPYEDPTQPIDTRIEDLLRRMNLEEKTGQLTTLYGFPRVLKDELPTELWDQSPWKDGIANIDEHINGNTGWTNNLIDPENDLPWSRRVRAAHEVQRWFVERTRLGVPVDFTNEGIRGLMHSKATSFPAQIGVASTWNAPLVRRVGEVTGREAHALGYSNVYSPVLDLSRDPRWGRVVECYSEDPFLTGTLGLEQVRGIQTQNVASTLKHYAVYSIPKGGRDGHARTDPQTTWREVQTIYLEPFRRAVMEGGALGVMASYNDYDGVPVQSSRLFLHDILREQWGFQGYVVSDSGSVEFIHQKHRVAGTPAEAIRLSVEAGLNVRTNFTDPGEYLTPLRELVRSGALSMEVIDARVRDVLRVKFRLGLFDRPYRGDPAEADRVVRSPEHLAVAAQVARESIILLKNDGLLPLGPEVKRVLVTGPLADDPNGWWSRYGAQRLDFVTPLAGLKAKLAGKVEVLYSPGVPVKDKNWPESDVWKTAPDAETRAGIEAAVRAAAGVDVVVAVLGETDELCRESSSRISLDLPGYQQELLEALHATGKPIVLVLSNGRPLSVNWAVKHVPSIVELWFPGEDGGTALADVLWGDYNPAGRLPVTVPRSVGQLPFNFPAHPGSQAQDYGQVTGALFPFGHGLSYTRFGYSGLKIGPERAAADATITVACEVTNLGDRAGDEVVQLYLRDDYSSVVGFEKVLRGFQRIHLASGEKRQVEFTLQPADLALYDQAGRWTVEPGRFTVEIGASSEDPRLRGNFVVTTPEGGVPDEAPIIDASIDPR